MGGVARYHVDRRSFLPGDVYIIRFLSNKGPDKIFFRILLDSLIIPISSEIPDFRTGLIILGNTQIDFN